MKALRRVLEGWKAPRSWSAPRTLDHASSERLNSSTDSEEKKGLCSGNAERFSTGQKVRMARWMGIEASLPSKIQARKLEVVMTAGWSFERVRKMPPELDVEVRAGGRMMAGGAEAMADAATVVAGWSGPKTIVDGRKFGKAVENRSKNRVGVPPKVWGHEWGFGLSASAPPGR